MLTNVYLLKYNNYFNRQVKRLETLEDYLPYFIHDVIQNCHFNPNDDVDTELIVNYEGEAPDYVLIFNNTDNSYDAEPISRWFVMDASRTRQGQYRMRLRRDVVADNLDSILQAPCYIEKATLSEDDPLIFNSEGMTFNQIKQSETLLKDSTKCGWIVGYLDNTVEDTEINGEYESEYELDFDISDEPLYRYSGGTVSHIINLSTMKVWYRRSGLNETEVLISPNGAISWNDVININPGVTTYKSTKNWSNVVYPLFRNSDLKDYIGDNRKSSVTKNVISLYNSRTVVDNPKLQDGRIIFEQKTGYYYRVSVKPVGTSKHEMYINSGHGSLYTTLKAELDALFAQADGTGDMGPYTVKLYYTTQDYQVEFLRTTNPTATIKMNWPSTYTHLSDAPYSMFCIPYHPELDVHIGVEDGVTKYMSKALSIGVANSIIKTLAPASSGGHIYDLQLLPYCPLDGVVPYSDITPGIDMSGMLPSSYMEVKKTEGGSETTIGYVYFCKKSSFQLNIPYEIIVNNKKLSKECEKWRLVAPNYSSIDDFSPAMNDGVNYIHVDFTYKPYNPYIKLHINYKGLYGSSDEDARGLICGGDFSLPMISDAWETYQIQNKNYLNIFDRNQQHLEVENKIARQEAGFGIGTGIVQGAVGGAMAGSVAGPWGAVAGAVVGAGASAVGGAMDYANLQKRQDEQMGYNVDMFNYNLGNIQALPNGLAKVSAFDINNKVWPFVEFFSCTPEEKEAFEEKLKYNGMTVMKIGKIKDYVVYDQERYIQGQLIRLNVDDAHMTQTIYSEIARGVFI